MRGRKPKPIAQQIAEGDPRKHGKQKLQARAAAEPQPIRGTPPCPRHVTGLARKMWRFWTEQLAAMKQDYLCDAAVIEGACVNYARAVLADKALAKHGLTCETSTIAKDGTVVVLKTQNRPEVAVANAAWRIVRSFCSEMGLSLVSRTRLTLEKQDQGGDLMELLRQPRVKRELQPSPPATVQ